MAKRRNNIRAAGAAIDSLKDAVHITPALLRRTPLPPPEVEGDKKERGRVLVVAGGSELVGTPVLAATAVLRAGAGKVRIATCRSIASFVGLGVPEARVFAMPQTRAGGIAATSAGRIAKLCNEAEALLIGPGMIDEKAVAGLLKGLLSRIESTTVILDATALKPLSSMMDQVRRLNGNTILTPHAYEMAAMLSIDSDEVKQQPLHLAQRTAAEFNAVVVLKGATTIIASPDGSTFYNTAGNVGLATTGSGDTLAGIITGLSARGAEPLVAAIWGVYLHAKAGEQLARESGLLGYLAREIPGTIPGLLHELS